MKQLSNWSSPTAPLTFGRASRPGRHAVVVLCLLGHIMTACTSSLQLPTQFEAIHRIPVKTVLVHDQRIAYLDVGTGAPVILIHGFGGSMWQWEHQQDVLSEHFRILTPDLPGSGLSDKPKIEYRPDQILDFFIGFMDAVEISQATLVGNSMGAGLAIGMALAHPSRVTKLILIGGLPQHVMMKLTSPMIRRALETRTPAWLVSLGNRLFGGWMTESILKEIVHDPALLTPTVIERSNRNRLRPGVITPIMTVREALPLWEAGFATQISDITHPTLVIWGQEDRVFPIAVGEELHHTITGSQFMGIPNAGHLPQWEQPDLVNQSLIEYIRS